MKKKRHELILNYIKNNNVSRQEEIIKMLLENGYNVTQATISRDIKELKIIKEHFGKNDIRYAVSEKIDNDDNHFNIILAHDFFKFSTSQVANYGKAIELDNFTQWFGVDYIALGHVHKIMKFKGHIFKDGLAREVVVDYLGCMTRPSYRDGHMDENGQVLIFTVYDDGSLDVDTEIIPLWSLDESFNLEVKQKQQQKKEEKAARVDISDVVKQLDAHDRSVGNPEDIINTMTDVDEKYKAKAIELLKNALA